MEEPFFGHIVSNLAREFTERIPTLGVGLTNDGICLRIHPGFFFETVMDDRIRVGLLKHEVLHVVFHHLRSGRGKDLSVYGIACDLAVNEFLESDELTDGALRIGKNGFPDCLHGKDSEWIYDYLMEHRPQAGFSSGLAATHEGWLSSEGTGIEESDAKSALERIVVDAWVRTKPEDRSSVNEGIQEVAERQARDRKGVLAQVDWRRSLRIFSASTGRARLTFRYRRISRRYGTVPAPRLRRDRRVAVAVDISGSITDEVLALFFEEVDSMHRSGTAITVIECDDEVRKVYPYAGRIPEFPKTRGGTSFDPAVQWVNERTGTAFSGLVYLTDGEAYPLREIPRCRILWVLSPDAREEPPGPRFGLMIRIPSP